MASRQTATGTGQAGVTGGGKVNLEGEVSIAADGATNSLIINAARGDYEKIKQVIEVLDIKRRQVIVEATLLEVSLNQEEGMGIELQGTAAWDDGAIFAQTNYDNLTNLLTRPNALSDLTIAAASSGTITLPGGIVIPSQAILVTALSKHQNVNVLSAPTILATDNEEAEIIVGENVPFVSSTSTNQTNLNNTFNQIDRQDVGITLRITPQIGTGDYVGLHMFVEISNVVPTTRNDPNGPTTTIRTSETQVEVKDGQMIVTGGLLQDRVSDSVRGVPFFKDIPVIGQWFQRQDNLTNRTNLLVFITPRVVVDQYDARDATKEYASGLSGYIEENEVQPDRRAVLESRSMDKVVEEAPVAQDRRLPTTVTPPRIKETLSEEEQEASERTMARLKALEKSKAAYPSSPEAAVRSPAKDTDSLTADDIIDVTVSPQLPQTNTNSSEEASPPSPALPDAPPAPGPFSAVTDALPTMEAKTATLKKAFSEKS
ncbi:MAG TPA: secretin N-terminal domain-containing protein, partial [Oligoflexia bacterium]|nr:secretin N-terminal domain-containing protein [Oligoflexia bacterium]